MAQSSGGGTGGGSAQVSSAGSGIKTKPLNGFGKLGRWLNSLRADLVRTEVMGGLGTAINQTASGRSVDTNAPNDGGGGGGGSDFETITGAVNGVPSTLNVATDGATWVPV
jgi:hypothetical protein